MYACLHTKRAVINFILTTKATTKYWKVYITVITNYLSVPLKILAEKQRDLQWPWKVYLKI